MLDDNPDRRAAYETPLLIELGYFRELTGYVGLKNRESLIGYPRDLW
ncbi:keywimysin-related RiPP [Nonomuraea sp. NPDC002799]